jgi:magnesium chelatase family protein
VATGRAVSTWASSLKDGGGFDLPIALGILAASDQIPDKDLDNCEFLGELSLNGELRSVRGVLPAAIRTRDIGRCLVIPVCNAAEAALVNGGEKYGGMTLLEIANWVKGGQALQKCIVEEVGEPPLLPDLRDVIGLPGPKRALEIAAAGAHHLLFAGPPGTGKTLLASRLPRYPATDDGTGVTGSRGPRFGQSPGRGPPQMGHSAVQDSPPFMQ